ncbi:MAG: 16S rRNA (cytosine(967)-C(5))-methyltransferase RsmB [Lachnospiraceae bacterium]|nr:16S rRNA (cytosine(967)-C(5))-methyltransferase RsmB [Lachnospiraceae bacterium]
MAVNERDFVLDILTEHERSGASVSRLVSKALDEHPDLPLSERAFIKRLSEGTVERREELDKRIRGLLKNPDGVIKPRVLWLLRMSVYQIYYMDSVPDHAACDEAVRILKRRRMLEYTGFVNGVLRNICRQKNKEAAVPETKTNDAAEKQTVAAPSLTVPSFVKKMWEETYGEEETQKLLAAMLQPRPVCIRFDDRIDEESICRTIEQIRVLGGKAEAGRWNSCCWYLRHIPAVNTLPGFREGLWTVQDESSQLLGLAAVSDDPEQRPQLIVDVCAAPGGKSIHLAGRVPEAKIISCDISSAKTKLIRAAAARMHCGNMEIREQDASEQHAELLGKADILLCDVPCSGLGVMTRKRDIRENVSPEKIRSLISLQKKILRASAGYVKPGGILMYSTCTINRDENEKMVSWIRRELGFEEEELTQFLPEGLPGIEKGHVQLLPHVHGTDGFFMARLRKPNVI